MSAGAVITVQDGGLGQVKIGGGRTMVVIGCTSTGTPNQILQSSNPNDFINNFGYGPATEAAALIANVSGNPVIMIKASTQVIGTNSAVSHPTGGGTSAVTLTGTPNDTYYGLVTVSTAGTINAGPVNIGVSLDNGRTSQPVALGSASTYVIPNTGLTLNFGNGNLTTADTFKWVSTEPKWSQTFVTSAVSTLKGYATQWLNVLLTGDCTASDFTNVDANATTLFNNKQFTRFLTNARDAVWGGTSTETEAAWSAAVQADYSSATSTRVSVSAGHYNTISPISQINYRRPASWFAAVRDSQQNLGQDIGQTTTLTSGVGGPMAPMVITGGSLFQAAAGIPDGFVYHDELQNPGFDAAGFLSFQSYQGLPGLYVTNPNVKAPPGSDFNWLQRGEIVDQFSRLVYQFFTQQLSSAVRVNATTGFILNSDANDLETRCNALLKASLVGSSPPAATAAYVVINRATNILSTSQLIVTGSIIPLGYIKSVPITIRFVNPALAQAAP